MAMYSGTASPEDAHLYRAVFDTIPWGVIIQNSDGAVMAANPAAQKILGVSLQYLQSYPSLDPRWRAIRADGSPFPEEEYPGRVALRSGQTVCDVVMGVFDSHTKAYTWLNVTAAPSEPSGTVMISFEDITQRKQIDERLHTSERAFKLFVEHAPAAIAMLDKEMKYLAVSQRYLVDYRLGDQNLLGRSHYDVFPEISERWKQIHRRCLAGATEKADEDPFPREDGSLDWVHWEIHPWYDDAGQVGGILLFSEVITEKKQKELALLEQKQQLHALVTSLDDIVFEIDAEGRCRNVWTANESLLAVPKEQVLGQCFVDILGPEKGQLLLDALQRALAHDTTESVEYSLEVQDGQRWFLARINPMRLLQGAPQTVSVLVRDITERKQAEMELEATHRHTIQILESISDAFYSLDQRDRFTYVNQKAASLWHKTAEELLGKVIWDALPWAVNTDTYRYMRQARAALQPFQYETYSTFLNQWIEVHIYPTAQDLSVYFQDITERKKTEEELLKNTAALRKSEEKFAKVFRSSPIAISISTFAEGRIMEVNDSFMDLFGFSQADLIGHTAIELNLYPDLHDRKEIVRRTQEKGSFRDYELRLRTKNDGIRTVLFSSESIEIDGQEYLLALIVDISKRKAAEEAAYQNQAKLLAALNSMTDAVVISNAEGTLIDFNDAFATFHRFKDKTECSQVFKDYERFIEVYQPEGGLIPVEEWPLFRGLRGEVATNAEYDLRRKDTGERWNGSYSFSPIRDENGAITGSVVVARDITTRKQAELQISQLTRLYAVLSQINQTVVREKTRDELFAEICQVALKFGQFRLAWIGHYDPQSQEVIPVVSSQALPFDRVNVDQAHFKDSLIGTALRTGQVAYSNDMQTDPYLPYWHEMAVQHNYHAAAAVPLRFHGQVDGLLNLYSEDQDFFILERKFELLDEIGKDISFALDKLDEEEKRQQAEEEITHLLERLNLATRIARVGIWDWDILQNHTAWDEAMYALYGQPKDAFSTTYDTWLETVHPDDRAANVESVQQALRGEKGYDCEFRVVWPDGSIHWLKALGQVFYDAQGQPTRMVGVNYDLTEIKQAHQQLEENNQMLEQRVKERTAELDRTNAELLRANQSKDEFLSTISHELRTPLNGILNLSESLQEGTYGEITSQQEAILGTIRESGEHLLNLINDLLDLSKAESGHVELQLKPVVLRDLIDASLRLTNPQAMRKRLRIYTALDSNLGTITGDERRLKQMLVNLLSNAIKFTPEGGHIGLEVTRENEGESVRFTVWDSGIGIPADKIHQLFQPFTQIDNSLSRQYTGSGLGLALVSRLAQLHGGSVGVESEEGKGSRFWFTIPVLQTVEVEQPLADDEVKVPVQAPRRALVIEDSLVAADHLARYLRELNTEVIIHSQGQDAVQAVIDHKPDVILLDILLPDTLGWQVLDQLKTNPHTYDIPVVIISVVDDRNRGLAAGAVEYLVKPVTREQLHAAILKAISPEQHANLVMLIQNPLSKEESLDSASSQGATILFVEDNLINLESYVDFLKSKGHHVIPAVNGYEAIERAEEFNPDLILMDIQLPGMDGLETIRRLRADPDFAQVPIIALTALAMPGDRERCLAAGANAYLTKPVGLKQLLKEITTWIGHHE